MSLTSDNMSPADIAAVTGNNGGAWGNEGGAYWLLILFLFCFMGWGNNGGGWNSGGGPGPSPYATSAVTQADVQRGFDQSALVTGLNGLTQTVNNGFANAEVSRCNQQGNILQQMNTNNASILQTLNSNNSGVLQQLNSMAYNQLGNANNCAAGLADLKYTVSQENAADRASMQMGFQQLDASIGAKTQAILDRLCQQEIEQKNDTINQLRSQLNLANLAASQNQQTGQLMADNAAQTQALYNQLKAPSPVPAYVVPNPNGCNCGYGNYSGGCCA